MSYIVDANGIVTECTDKKAKKIVIKEGVKQIAPEVFTGCEMEVVYLPNSLKRIGYLAFYSCPRLRKVYFGNGLKVIEQEAFAYCFSLKSVKLPESIDLVGRYSFVGIDEMMKLRSRI